LASRKGCIFREGMAPTEAKSAYFSVRRAILATRQSEIGITSWGSSWTQRRKARRAVGSMLGGLRPGRTGKT